MDRRIEQPEAVQPVTQNIKHTDGGPVVAVGKQSKLNPFTPEPATTLQACWPEAVAKCCEIRRR